MEDPRFTIIAVCVAIIVLGTHAIVKDFNKTKLRIEEVKRGCK